MDLLAHLETFIAVADQRSFSRAAEELGMAQPLLSRRIKNLERTLGGELFDRSQRQIRVTDFGVVLLPHAQDVLHRARHLRSVAQSARSATVHPIGVPPDCDPSALARVIRAAADRGIAVSIRESPARERAIALAEGHLAFAAIRGAVERSSLIVPMGLASAVSSTTPGDEHPIHLDSLRPRRGARAEETPAIRLMPEDDLPLFTSRLDRAMATAGLPRGRVRVSSSTASAAAEVMASTDLLLCDGAFAHRHGLAWRPLADRSLHRGYELEIGDGRFGLTTAGELTGWLTALIGAVLGVNVVAPTRAEDARERLSVRA